MKEVYCSKRVIEENETARTESGIEYIKALAKSKIINEFQEKTSLFNQNMRYPTSAKWYIK